MKSASLPVLQVYDGDGTGAPVPTPQHPVTVFLSSMGWVVYVSLRFVVKVRANVCALAGTDNVALHGRKCVVVDRLHAGLDCTDVGTTVSTIASTGNDRSLVHVVKVRLVVAADLPSEAVTEHTTGDKVDLLDLVVHGRVVVVRVRVGGVVEV